MENPESAIAGTSDGNDPLPDLTTKYKGSAGSLPYSLSGVVTQLETDDEAAAPACSAGSVGTRATTNGKSAGVLASVISRSSSGYIHQDVERGD